MTPRRHTDPEPLWYSIACGAAFFLCAALLWLLAAVL